MSSLKPIQSEFIDYLCHAWQSSFIHKYTVKKGATWNRWIKETNSNIWECSNLQDAFKKYCWGTQLDDERYRKLSADLQTAIKSNNNDVAALCCLEIFDWGRVSRRSNDRSKKWVKSNAEQQQLCQKIKDAINLTSGISNQDLIRFDGNDLLMNSSLTKIYAAADVNYQIVIYDGRVGAALGLLARLFLEEKGLNNVPIELEFYWGAPTTKTAALQKTRDPSKGNFVFPKLPNTSSNKNADLIRATISRKTNLYLNNVISTLNKQNIEVTSQSFEKALFMVGYDVRR